MTIGKYIRIFLLASILLPATTMAQFTVSPTDARSAAMGGCLNTFVDKTFHIAIGYRQGYLVSGMATRNFIVSSPIGKRSLAGAYYTHFGDPDYHEQQAAATYSIAVSDWLTIGVYGLYSHQGTSDPHYSPYHTIDGGASVIAETKDITAYAVAGSRRWDNNRPWILRTGLAYKPLLQFLTIVELDIEHLTRFRCGMEYSYRNGITLRTGFATNPLVMTFGAGYKSNRYHIDLSTETHSTLGLSPQISIGICL